MEKIEIYTQESCKYCEQVIQEFENNNIDFVEKSIVEFGNEWYDIVNLTGLPTTPTVLYKNNYFIPGRDFNNAQTLIQIINNFKECKFSNIEQILERGKTLSYSISMAFGRLDNVLKSIESKLENEETEEK